VTLADNAEACGAHPMADGTARFRRRNGTPRDRLGGAISKHSWTDSGDDPVVRSQRVQELGDKGSMPLHAAMSGVRAL